jgi:hypothetical protein
MRRLKKKTKKFSQKNKFREIDFSEKILQQSCAFIKKRKRRITPITKLSHHTTTHTLVYFFLRENVSHKKTKTFVCLENAITHLS